MIEWLIVIGIILVVYVVIKMHHFRHVRSKIYILFVASVLLFIFVSGMILVKKNNINILSFNGVISTIKIYFSWLFGVFANAKDVTGSVVENVGNYTARLKT